MDKELEKLLNGVVSKIDDLRCAKITDADPEAYDRHLYEMQMDIFKAMDKITLSNTLGIEKENLGSSVRQDSIACCDAVRSSSCNSIEQVEGDLYYRIPKELDIMNSLPSKCKDKKRYKNGPCKYRIGTCQLCRNRF